MKSFRIANITAAVIALSMLHAQAQTFARIHGHVVNPAGLPVTNGDVRLTLDKNPNSPTAQFSYIFPLDSNGYYSGAVDKPGAYTAVVFQGQNHVDFMPAQIAAGDDKAIDFDMTRQEYIDKMSPADREALERYKQQAASTAAVNSQIAQLNQMLIDARSKTTAGQCGEAVTLMQTATQLRPAEPILWQTLGDAQFCIAKASAAAARKAGRTPTSLPDVVQQFQNAADSYRQAAQLNGASPKPSPDIAGAAWNQLGSALGLIGRSQEAVDAYNQAISANPGQAKVYAFNEAATLYNAGDTDDAANAAAQAIALDPAKAMAYYIRGQSLVPKATINPKTGKIQAPPGCIESYEAYLQLDPNGPYAADVRGVLAGLGARPSSAPISPAAVLAGATTTTPAPAVAATASISPPAPRVSPAVSSPRAFAPEPPAPSAQQAVTIPIPHNYALIFATDDYAHWPHLQNPIFDADTLNSTLTSLYGFQVEEIKNPTAEEILRKLTEYLHRHFEVQDQLMIVFSGHGYFDPDLGQGFIAPADALRVEDDLGHRSLLAHETIMEYVNRIPSKHVVLVIDACFAGTLDRKIADSGLRGDPSEIYAHATLPELLLRKESKRTRRYFASGGKDFVPDGLPGHHSPFIAAFLDTLNQAADRKGYVTLDDLQEGLNTVNPEPRWGDIQGDNEPGADFLLLTSDAVHKLSATN